jgi:hypothetical protein
LHVACRTVVLSNDDEDDLESLVGFDDDALLVDAVRCAMGAPGLAIPLVPP